MRGLVARGLPALLLAGSISSVLVTDAAEADEKDGITACRTEISKLRYQVAGEEGLKEGDHELLGGLSAEEAGQPEENWFGSPPEKEAAMEKLDEAGKLAADGDVEGCQAMVEEVRLALRPADEQ